MSRKTLESQFKTKIAGQLTVLLPYCVLLKNDEQFMPGIPDMLILYQDRWAMLEFKRSAPRRKQDYEPNQEYYLRKFNDMAFASVIYPDNASLVLQELVDWFHA